MGRTYIEKHANQLIFFLAIFIATLVTAAAVWKVQEVAAREEQAHLAQEVLRFHVLANSDSEEDQALKLEVRDSVLTWLEEEMPQNMDVDGTTQWVRSHTEDLEEVSRMTLEENGSDYPVSAAVTTCYFPEKTYGDVTFPAGNYEALRIEIGDADGHNWWCVLYPNLCFLDTTNAVVPDEGKQKLKNVLTEEEYSRITADTKFKIKWYFWEEDK